ncbi:MAG: formylglycine-generating enzyme family protein [Chitinophagaceae bacterium]|jgi:formylglycine-generating enzyme required for sulfatase activity
MVNKLIALTLFYFSATPLLAQPVSKEDIRVPGTNQVISMIGLQGGTFTMGNNTAANTNEKPSRQLQISPFSIGVFEITHDQFDIFFKDEETSQGSKVDAITRPTPQYIDLSWNMGKEGGYPANSMSVDAALMFCRWLYQKTGKFFRLPTEAEWEYACRAGTQTEYFFGNSPDKLSQYAWYQANSNGKYQKVGSKKPNPWGLYDMLGNVAEWTMDQYDPNYFKKTMNNEKDKIILPVSRYPRSIRGGSYLDDGKQLRSSNRQFSETGWNKRDPQLPKSRWWLTDGMFVGFRIVCPVNQPSPEEAEKLYKLYLGN